MIRPSQPPAMVALVILLSSAGMAAASTPKAYLSQARVGTHCWTLPTTTAEATLDCWLREHKDVAEAMKYHDASYDDYSGWTTWPVAIKDQLRFYFGQMVTWYHAGMPPKGYPKPFPIPIPKNGPDDPAWGLRMSEARGRAVYLSHTANSLAAELTGAFPWTIATYTSYGLYLLLAMQEYLRYVTDDVAQPGFYFQFGPGAVTPATPGYTVTFFKTNNLIGTSAADTIGRLFTWEKQLVHYFYYQDEPYPDPKLHSYFWGPAAPPIAASSVIEGTTYSGPSVPMFAHYTAGCGGTQMFMKTILRAVNIPVELRWSPCTHATPVFPTVDLALTHGDDPYARLGWVSPFQGFLTPQSLDYFVPISALDQLFPPGQDWDECDRATGLRVVDIAIHFGSDELMKLYCSDLAANVSHADGKVYKQLKGYYPLQMLENLGLWTTLDTKVSATGFCALIK